MFDQHHRGIGNIDPDFDYRGRNQDVGFIVPKCSNRRVFFSGGEFAVEQADLVFGEDVGLEILVGHDRRFQIQLCRFRAPWP